MAEKQNRLDEMAYALYKADALADDPSLRLLLPQDVFVEAHLATRYRAMAAAVQTDSQNDITARLDAIETAIQLLTGNIINLRTELLVIKAVIVPTESEG